MEVKGEHIPGYDVPNACFTNVWRLMADKGGSMVMGWRVSRREDYICRIHHAVWRKPSGELVDVSPQFDPDISTALGEPHAALMKASEFEPDESATLVDGRTRPIQYLPTQPKYGKFVQYLERSERAIMNGNENAANYWTERADKERHRARGDKYNPAKPTIHKPFDSIVPTTIEPGVYQIRR